MPPNLARRDPAARSAILSTALEMCREVGFARLSIEGIARRAGVGKQTVYRWWPSLFSVVLEALSEASADTTAFPDTGDIRADLRTQMRAVAGLMGSSAMAPYAGLIGAAQSDPRFSHQLYDAIIGPRIEACRERIAKAQASGEIRSDIDPGSVVELLYAPLYYRLLLHIGQTTPDHADDVIDLVFAGVAGAEPSARRRH